MLPNMKELLCKAFGDSQGPLGIPMHSESAREIEQLMKDRPAEVKDVGLCRMTCISKASTFEDGEHADVSMVTTSTLDRDREVVLAGGIDWKQFRKSPVVTFAHMYDALPVGKCLWIKSEKLKNGTDGWIAKTRYTPRPGTDLWPATEPWFADAVYHMVKTGDLNGKSIGFLPMSARAPTDKELKDNPTMTNCRVVFDKCIALEYAVAPVQANPDALVQTVSKCRKSGMQIPDKLLFALGMIVPDFDSEAEEVVAKAISQQQEAEPEHLTLTAYRESVLAKVEKSLAGLNIGSIVTDVIDRKRGRI